MTCREYRDLAELLRDGALDAETAAAARAHLETCADCRAFEDESALCLVPVRELPTGPYLPPDSPWRPLPPWLGGGGAAVGAVLALLALGGAAAMGAFRSTAQMPESGAADTRETAAVETTPSPAPEPPPSPPPAAPRPALPDGRYEGRVVDEAGAPVPGAIVTVAGFPPVTTDAAGLFAVPGVAPGPSRRIRIEAQGCVPLDGLAPPSWPTARTTLAAIQVGPPRAARVRVVAPDGRPAAGARVRASFLAGELYPHSRPTYRPGEGASNLPVASEAAAGADGIATLEGLGPGPWTFTAEFAGCAPSYPETGVPGSGGDGPDATVILESAVPLEGRVVDPDGVALPGSEVAWVRASSRGQEGDLRHEGVVRAGADGEFRFAAVPTVPLSISVRHPVGTIRAEARLVDPLVTPRVFLVALPVGTRHGIATDDAGAPAGGAVVQAQPLLASAGSTGDTLKRVATGPDGRFVLDGAPIAAPWRLGAVPGGAWTSGPFDPSALSATSLRQPAALLTVRLRRTGSIEGVVRGADGAPVPAVEVRAFVPMEQAPQFPMFAGLVRTDASGRFLLDGVPAGPALVVPGDDAWDEQGGRGIRRLAPALTGEAGSIPHRVEVPAGGRARTDCPLWTDMPDRRAPAAPARVRGTVVGPDGAPVPGVRVLSMFGGQGIPDWMLRAPYGARSSPVAADGAFDATCAADASLPPGMGMPVLVLALAPDGRRGLAYAKVAAGGVEEGVRVVVEADRAVEGRLLEEDGSPAAGALIDACPAGDAAVVSVMPRAAAGPDGHFRIRGLPAVALLLIVDRPGRETVSIPVPADAAMPIEIRLPGDRTVRGRIEGPEGGPAADVPVRWYPTGVLCMPHRTRSGADGSFEFPGVPRVPFRIEAGAIDSADDSGEFVQGSREFAVDEPSPRLALARGASVRGSVEDSTGRPASGADVTAAVEQGGTRLFRRARVHPDGRFEIAGLPAGAPVGLDARVGALAGAARVVEGGEEAAIRLSGAIATRAGVGIIEGRVLGTDGEPVARATIRVLDPETGCVVNAHGWLDERGFAVEAPLGRAVTIEVDYGGGDCVYLEGVRAGAGQVVVRRGGARGTLRGRVVGPDGSPVTDAVVTAIRRGPAAGGRMVVHRSDDRVPRWWAGVRSGRSAADGSFDLGSPEGRWVVFAGTPGTAAAPRTAAGWDANMPADVEVGVGDGWTLRVAPAGAGSARAAFVEVRLPGFLPGDAADLTLRRVASGEGPLEIGGLPPFPAEVVLRSSDGREVRREVVQPTGD